MKKYKHRNQYSSGHSFRDSARKRRNAAINKSYSRAEKARRGCEVTGLPFRPEELQWHHVKPKRFNIGQGYHRSFKSFKEELAKCIAVHANVHGLLHR